MNSRETEDGRRGGTAGSQESGDRMNSRGRISNNPSRPAGSRKAGNIQYPRGTAGSQKPETRIKLKV